MRTGTARGRDADLAAEFDQERRWRGPPRDEVDDKGQQLVLRDRRTSALTRSPDWYIAMCPGKREKLNPFIEPDFVTERVEKMKASIRAKAEHPFWVTKRQWLHQGALPRLREDTAQLITLLFALSNLRMAQRKLMDMRG